MVAPPRVTITVPSLRVPRTVAPPKVIESRVPMISQEENIENIRHMDVVESKKINISTTDTELE